MSSEISNAVFCAAVLLGIVYGSRILEKTWPIAPVSGDEFRADWLAVIVSVGLEHLFAPLAAISAGAIASYVGLGWIKLPTEGYRWYVSFAIVVVALDLYKYTFHRLQHAIPLLWAMHSFHHSANGITFITGARHFWLERVLSDAFLPIMAILFRIPPDMAIAAAFIFFVPDACAHLNVRIPLGRFVTWINNPPCSWDTRMAGSQARSHIRPDVAALAQRQCLQHRARRRLLFDACLEQPRHHRRKLNRTRVALPEPATRASRRGRAKFRWSAQNLPASSGGKLRNDG